MPLKWPVSKGCCYTAADSVWCSKASYNLSFNPSSLVSGLLSNAGGQSCAQCAFGCDSCPSGSSAANFLALSCYYPGGIPYNGTYVLDNTGTCTPTCTWTYADASPISFTATKMQCLTYVFPPGQGLKCSFFAGGNSINLSAWCGNGAAGGFCSYTGPSCYGCGSTWPPTCTTGTCTATYKRSITLKLLYSCCACWRGYWQAQFNVTCDFSACGCCFAGAVFGFTATTDKFQLYKGQLPPTNVPFTTVTGSQSVAGGCPFCPWSIPAGSAFGIS